MKTEYKIIRAIIIIDMEILRDNLLFRDNRTSSARQWDKLKMYILIDPRLMMKIIIFATGMFSVKLLN